MLNLATIIVVAFIGWVSGWYSGTSSTSISSTIVPLFFGLLSVLALSANSFGWMKLSACVAFTLAFMSGLDQGEHVDHPIGVQHLINELGIQVEDAVFHELVLLDVQSRVLELDATRHNEIMFSVAGDTIMDTKLTIDRKIENLRAFRDSLHNTR